MRHAPVSRLARVASWGTRLPWGLLAIAATLSLVGLLAIARSEELAGGSGSWERQQLRWLLLAPVAFGLAMVVNLRRWSAASYAIYGAALAALVLVYFFPTVHGTHRWIRWGSLSVQPSEFAKLALVLGLARWLMDREHIRSLRGWLVPLGMTIVPVVLILREPDLGTSMILLPILVAMLFVAGARWRDLGQISLCGLLIVPVLWTQMNHEQRSRVTALFTQAIPGERPHADDYQLYQAKQLMALGGVTGSSWYEETIDDRTVYHLPESHCDFIFTVIGERWGWWGTGGVLLLHLLLSGYLLSIAASTRDPYGRLLATGIGAMIATQVLINTAMTVGLLPVTGVSLPLVSYGGSNFLMTSAALGLAANVSMQRRFEMGNEPFRYAI